MQPSRFDRQVGEVVLCGWQSDQFAKQKNKIVIRRVRRQLIKAKRKSSPVIRVDEKVMAAGALRNDGRPDEMRP
jgi:hypothetical protein